MIAYTRGGQTVDHNLPVDHMQLVCQSWPLFWYVSKFVWCHTFAKPRQQSHVTTEAVFHIADILVKLKKSVQDAFLDAGNVLYGKLKMK